MLDVSVLLCSVLYTQCYNPIERCVSVDVIFCISFWYPDLRLQVFFVFDFFLCCKLCLKILFGLFAVASVCVFFSFFSFFKFWRVCNYFVFSSTLKQKMLMCWLYVMHATWNLCIFLVFLLFCCFWVNVLKCFFIIHVCFISLV